ncbi:TetR/AcrR family transcriptional regulator [Litoreibacter albidus]|uniref:Transcriptional regulator, TetR family n=1 Tax=Litoreibacter albidus TaxID=670155 RepID=A0A1H3BEY0_9RHOB|nr:TetR family transcriptional regulator [Litoreibacter albidus]SDX40512.1 transcriptional regulator, TetR family [Litoreibacter albidus]
MSQPHARQRGSKNLWINAAYEMLVSDGIDAVKIMALAKKLNLSRTGFYWFFTDLKELHAAMIERWENKNTGTLVERCNRPASNISEGLFNLMDCWLDPSLFDAGLDLAIRNWARVDDDLQRLVNEADSLRIKAIADLFERHGFPSDQAHVRSLTVIYTQIGYISLGVEEARRGRLARVQHYVEIFSGTVPSTTDVEGFLARHI